MISVLVGWLLLVGLLGLITFDVETDSGYQAAQSSYTFSHTATGSNRWVCVSVHIFSVAGTVVSSIAYGAGNNMVFLGSVTDATNVFRCELWGFEAPSTSATTITVTLSGVADSVAICCTFKGMDQTVPTEDQLSVSGTGGIGTNNVDVTVNPTADSDWMVYCITTAASGPNTTAGGSQTSRAKVSGALGTAGFETNGTVTPPAATLLRWVVSGASIYSAIGICLRPLAAVNIVEQEDDLVVDFPVYTW